MYSFGGLHMFAWVFAILFMFGMALHLFFRWKTDRWTKSWGLYKKLDLPDGL